MTQTIFSDDQSTATQQQGNNAPVSGTPATETIDNNPVATLVGEGRKYKSVEELAKAYLSADGFIERLKTENHQLREVATKAKTIDEVLERLQSKEQEPVDKSVTPSEVVSASDVAKIVEQTIRERDVVQTREANLKKADAALKNVLGEKAAEAFAKAADTPEKKQVLMDLAAVDPDKFVALFAPNVTPRTTPVDHGSINTTAISLQAGDRSSVTGTKEFFDKVRRDNPSKYYSQEFQIMMDKSVRNNPGLYYGQQ